MIEFAKYIGFTVIAVIFLAVPSLLTLAIVFDWGFLLGLLLGGLCAVEVFTVVFILENLSEEWR